MHYIAKTNTIRNLGLGDVSKMSLKTQKTSLKVFEHH